MSVCVPQLRGALRALSDEFPSERAKFEHLFKLINALEVTRYIFVELRLGFSCLEVTRYVFVKLRLGFSCLEVTRYVFVKLRLGSLMFGSNKVHIR